MTAVEQSLRTYLIADTTVKDLIGSRVYPSRLPDNPTLPAVVYQKISTTYDIPSGHVAATRSRIQLDAWDDSQLVAWSVSEAIHAALDVGSATGIHASFPEDSECSYDVDSGLYRVRDDFFIWTIEE